MNNGNLPRNQPGLVPQSQQQQPQQAPQAQAIASLIRVEQIRNLPHLNDHQKTQYESGIRALHEALQNHSPDSPEYLAALQKLTEVSANVRNSYKRWQMQHQQQQQQQQLAGVAQAQQRIGSQPQAGQQRPQGQLSQGLQNPQGVPTQLSQFPPVVISHVHAFPFTLPPNILPGSADAEKWLSEAKLRYAQALHKAEEAKSRLHQLNNQIQQRTQAGKALSQEEINTINQRKALFTQYALEARRYIDSFRNQQHLFKAQGQGLQQGSSESIGGGVASATQPEAPTLVPSRSQQQPSTAPGNHAGTQSAPTVAPNHDSTGLTPNTVPESASQQAGTESRNVASPSTPAGQTLPAQVPTQSSATVQASSTQPSNTTPTVTAAPPTPDYQNFNPQQVPNAHPSVGPAGNPSRYPTHQPQGLPLQSQSQPPQPTQQNSPQSNQPPVIAQPEQPQSLTHQAALTQAARSYSNGVQNNSTPPTTGLPSHNHQPTIHDININKMPIPKNLNIPPPQPVSMPPARPSFTGGASNGTNGIMNQPAVPKMRYMLEGEGERVLSKKKLDELVRQVTGGGEGLGGQLLTPECEEAILQFADDFIDQVVTAACRVAKLRSSNTLELRDIQLVLERNYNIRIPGYSSDEIRTVKKFAPAPGWTQKMSAVQAAKVTGGKTDQ